MGVASDPFEETPAFGLKERVRVRYPDSSFFGRVGTVLGHVDGEYLVHLEGEQRSLRFGAASLEPLA